jgi:hypothetical protein
MGGYSGVVCMKGCRKELERFLEFYVKSRSISSVNEDSLVLTSKMFEFFSLLSFPSTEDTFLEGLKEKSLQSLWGIVTGNAVESADKGEEAISDCLQVVTKYRNRMNFSGKTEPGQVMHDFIQRFYNLPSGMNKKIAEELLFLDLTRILNGFDHQRIVQENDTTLSEYMEFGAVTGDLRIFLDIDIALYPYNLNLSTIGNLRKAYKLFSLAFKLSTDIAAFEREFFVERSHNAVTLYGQERGVLPRDVLRTEREYREHLYKCVIPPLITDIEAKGREYLSKSVECLKRTSEIDMGSIAAGFTSLFEGYLEQKALLSLG